MAKPYFRCDYSKYQSEPCDNAVCIPLTQGRHILVDVDDFDKIAQHFWQVVLIKTSIDINAYAVRGKMSVHRQIMPVPSGFMIDHKNANGLDNRKCNLRICTHTENQWNKRPSIGKGSRFKGVYFDKDLSKWRAQITNGRGGMDYIGVFISEVEAAKAFDRVAVARSNGFCWLNFPIEGDNRNVQH